LILHTFMVIALTVVVLETVLLVIVCNCVHCSLLFSSIFVLHWLRIKVYIKAIKRNTLIIGTMYRKKFIRLRSKETRQNYTTKGAADRKIYWIIQPSDSLTMFRFLESLWIVPHHGLSRSITLSYASMRSFARVFVKQRSRMSSSSSSAVLEKLHYLPLEWRTPLSWHLQHQRPTRFMRPGSTKRLIVPRTRTVIGSSAFSRRPCGTLSRIMSSTLLVWQYSKNIWRPICLTAVEHWTIHSLPTSASAAPSITAL